LALVGANQMLQLTAGSAVCFKGHFLSKFSVLVKFTVYLPASSELGVRLVVFFSMKNMIKHHGLILE
jgi:hypothetical protein